MGLTLTLFKKFVDLTSFPHVWHHHGFSQQTSVKFLGRSPFKPQVASSVLLNRPMPPFIFE
jgi:hypothetical protein